MNLSQWRKANPLSSLICIVIGVVAISLILMGGFTQKLIHSPSTADSFTSAIPTNFLNIIRQTDFLNVESEEVFSKEEQPKPKQKIAYLFAGSIRSFTCPRVHWSLRWNVIDAFGGEPYVFIRTSTEDNMNQRTGTGNIWKPSYTNDAINATLSILAPKKIEYFSLSDQLKEMKKEFPEMVHRVFQENDRRRYSMFFHRCMAYRMVLEYEKEHDMRFDWVALIRLDAAWLEPVFPIEQYSPDRVWLTETGYVPFNDQFMLIPREYADYIYDLNTKVDPKVYCLGGPDVEKWKCQRSELIKRKMDKELIHATLAHCCSDVLKGKNELGFSETIHLRHLLHGQIPVGFARFPVYITRLTKDGVCYPECSRLYHNFKAFVLEGLSRIYPYFAPLHPMDSRMVSLADSNIGKCTVINGQQSLWNPLPANDYIKSELYKKHPVDWNRNFFDQWNRFPRSIPYNTALFHAWKIRTVPRLDRCLALNFTSFEHYWDKDCRLHMRLKGGRRHFPTQAWFLQVDMHDERLLQPEIIRDELPLIPVDAMRPKKTKIFMHRRDPVYFESREEAYCITVGYPNINGQRLRRDNTTVHMALCDEKKDEDQHFQVIKGETAGNFPQSTLGMIKLARNSAYCVVRDEDDGGMATGRYIKSDLLKVDLCENYPPGRKYFEFELLSSW